MQGFVILPRLPGPFHFLCPVLPVSGSQGQAAGWLRREEHRRKLRPPDLLELLGNVLLIHLTGQIYFLLPYLLHCQVL